MGQRHADTATERQWSSSLVDEVRQAVDAHGPGDDRERDARRGVLAALDELPAPFDQDAGPCHVTGSAVVVGRRGTVLHLHKRLRIWLQPGGHLEGGESPWEAALRESCEETGLDLRHPADGPRLIHVDLHDAADGHEHLDLRYLLLADESDPRPGDGESPDVRWFSWDEAYAAADVALKGALVAARRHAELADAGNDGRSR